MLRIPYNNWNAITYAKNWRSKQDNVCFTYLQGDNKSDCAPFLAHCFDARGINVPDLEG